MEWLKRQTINSVSRKDQASEQKSSQYSFSLWLILRHAYQFVAVCTGQLSSLLLLLQDSENTQHDLVDRRVSKGT
jgi:hypothetical protein